MKSTLIAAAIASVLAIPAFAADPLARQDRQGQTVEQKKAEIIQHIEERISNSQAEKSCVQSAQTHDSIKACRDKYRPKQRGEGQGQERRPQMN